MGTEGSPEAVRVLRFGAGLGQAHYPLPVSETLQWRPVSTGEPVQGAATHEPTATLAADISLARFGPLPAGTLLLPSFVVPGLQVPSYAVSLRTESGTSWLQAVGDDDVGGSGTAPGVTSLIDVFRIDAACADATLTLHTNLSEPPSDYLFCVSHRPSLLTSPPASGSTGRARLTVPALSQRLLSRAIRDHACSPTALLMLLRQRATPSLPEPERFAHQCRDPRSGLFGVWPQNMNVAASYGVAAAVELCCGWDDVGRTSGAFAASIRFAPGGLPGAPLEQTSGHLVVVTGVDEAWVYVNDPAAPRPTEVPRRYPRAAFERAWLYERGVAYIVPN